MDKKTRPKPIFGGLNSLGWALYHESMMDTLTRAIHFDKHYHGGEFKNQLIEEAARRSVIQLHMWANEDTGRVNGNDISFYALHLFLLGYICYSHQTQISGSHIFSITNLGRIAINELGKSEGERRLWPELHLGNEHPDSSIEWNIHPPPLDL